MHRNALREKKQINIWLVFKNLELEMKFDNFTRVSCILYTDLVEVLNNYSGTPAISHHLVPTRVGSSGS